MDEPLGLVFMHYLWDLQALLPLIVSNYEPIIWTPIIKSMRKMLIELSGLVNTWINANECMCIHNLNSLHMEQKKNLDVTVTIVFWDSSLQNVGYS